MKTLVEIYSEAFLRHGNSPAAVLWPKGRQDVRFSALTRFLAERDFSILDFGCGLGHLLPFLESRFGPIRYTGVDIVPDFIRENQRLQGVKGRFQLIGDYREVTDSFDYVLMSGVFNLMPHEHESVEEHRSFVQDCLQYLFTRCDKILATDFMTDQVDFIQPRAFHQNPEEFAAFVRRTLSRRFIVDQSYLPYEFAATIFKKDSILRPDNSYGSETER